MKWNSADLNQTENLWKILCNKVTAKKPTTELWKRLEEEWIKITPEHCEKLVMPCSHRCAEVIQSTSHFLTLKKFKS